MALVYTMGAMTTKQTKRCVDCGELKDVEEFYAKRTNTLGVRRYARCKLCYNKWTYRKHGKSYVKRAGPREKELARDLLKKAVKDGRVKKPKRCDRCKEKKRPYQLEGHHHDYSKPLDIEWLCRPCHVKADRA